MSKKSIIDKIVKIENEYGIPTDKDRLLELDIDELKDILKSLPESGGMAKKKTKKKNTKVASLRSSKDKKFSGHTTYKI